MTNEQAYLLGILRSKMTNNFINPPECDLDYGALIKEARQQTVSLFLLDILHENDLPKEAYVRLQRDCSQIAAHNIRVSYGQKELVKLLENHKIPCAILKGESVAAYYPNPELRTLGDVDFLIEADKREAVQKLLLDNGYSAQVTDHDHHTTFHKNGAYFELHWQVPGIPDSAVGETIHSYFENCLQTSIMQKGVYNFFQTLTQAQQGVILLLHMQQHLLHEGIGLRHLCDWAAFVSATEAEVFWQASLLPILQKIGLATFANVMTKMSAIYLGIICPEWAQAPDDLCAQLIEDILKGGNFGKKDRLRAQSGMMIAHDQRKSKRTAKMKNLYATLCKAVKGRHPIVNRLPILYPVFGVYYVAKRLVLQLLGKRVAFRRFLHLADVRYEIYSQLHIFETE